MREGKKSGVATSVVGFRSSIAASKAKANGGYRKGAAPAGAKTPVKPRLTITQPKAEPTTSHRLFGSSRVSAPMAPASKGGKGKATVTVKRAAPTASLRQTPTLHKGGGAAGEALSPLVVVLDMDECLVHTQRFVDGTGRASASAIASYRQAESRPDARSASGCKTVTVPIEDGGTACVNLRPGLHEFLEALAKDPDIEVHVFTAALPLYARPVLNAIDPKNNLLSSRFYRKSCVIRNGVHGKDLKVIPGYSAERTLLIDNNPVSFLPNPQNGLLVTSWHDDNSDTQLNEVLDLLVRMKTERDVRPLIDGYCGARVRAATKRFAGLWTRGAAASF